MSGERVDATERERAWFCPQCGIVGMVDEDGLCWTCGATCCEASWAAALLRSAPESERRKPDAPPDAVVIWSGEHRAFWRTNGSGYCTNVLGAGIYDRDDAVRRTKHCGPEKDIEIRTLHDVVTGQEEAKGHTFKSGTVGHWLLAARSAPAGPRALIEAAFRAGFQSSHAILASYDNGADEDRAWVQHVAEIDKLTAELAAPAGEPQEAVGRGKAGWQPLGVLRAPVAPAEPPSRVYVAAQRLARMTVAEPEGEWRRVSEDAFVALVDALATEPVAPAEPDGGSDG